MSLPYLQQNVKDEFVNGLMFWESHSAYGTLTFGGVVEAVLQVASLSPDTSIVKNVIWSLCNSEKARWDEYVLVGAVVRLSNTSDEWKHLFLQHYFNNDLYLKSAWGKELRDNYNSVMTKRVYYP